MEREIEGRVRLCSGQDWSEMRVLYFLGPHNHIYICIYVVSGYIMCVVVVATVVVGQVFKDFQAISNYALGLQQLFL